VALASLKSLQHTDRLKIQVEFLCYSLEAELFLRETSVFAFKTLNRLVEATYLIKSELPLKNTFAATCRIGMTNSWAL
jgi:hypothetical protein